MAGRPARGGMTIVKHKRDRAEGIDWKVEVGMRNGERLEFGRQKKMKVN